MNTSLFERNGGTYSVVSDYHIPNLTLPNKSECQLGIWGQRRLDYLKRYRRVLYVNLLTADRLTEHLREIDATAFERREIIVKQLIEAQGVTEQLKSENAMSWVGKMNNICVCATEIIRNELIYD